MMKSLRLLVVATLAGVLLAGSTAAFAQDVKYKKTTEYSFEDDTIEGDLTRPDGEYVEAQKRVRHSNLIRIRDNFRDKILQSVGEL